MMDFLNTTITELHELAKKKRDVYMTAKPFPNIYFDDFFNADILRKVVDEFSDLDQIKENPHYRNPNEDKYISKGEYSLGAVTKQLIHFLNSQPFLEFLQEL